MLFRKKKRMIDVRELQRRGVVRIPKKDIVVPTNRDGFVEFGNKATSTSSNQTSSTPTSNSELFGFMDTTSSTQSNFSNSTDGYDKREVDEKITTLDNKIYKLENRIEVLEKKLNISQPSDTNVGVMGW
jgi:hypothetical protein